MSSIILSIYRQIRWTNRESSSVKTHFDDFTNSFQRSVKFYCEAHFSVSRSLSETNSALTVRFEELVKESIFFQIVLITRVLF